MRACVLLTSLGIVGFISGIASAQTASGATDLDRFQRQLESIERETRLRVDTSLPAEQRALIDYGGYLSFNFFAIDDAASNIHYLRQTELLGYARVSLDGAHEFFVRGSARYDDFNTGQSFDGQGDELRGPELDRAYYRFDLKRYLAAYEGQKTTAEFNVTAGRQLVHWANGLTLSQVLDGGDFFIGCDKGGLEVVAGFTPDLYNDIDSSRPGFDSHMNRAFYGAQLSAQIGQHRPFIYGLVQEDHNSDKTYNVSLGGVDAQSQFRYDSWYVGAGSRGNLSDKLTYGIELVYQGGSGTSSPYVVDGGVLTAVDQTIDDISAGAADFQLDYLLTDANRSRISGELILASGDNDRVFSSTNTIGGNTPGTTDHGFNSFGLVNTGLAFSPRVSNLAVARIGASTFPFPSSRTFNRLQVGGNFLIFSKLDGAAPIDEPTSSDAFLGVEPNTFVNWQITSDLSFALRYGVFFPGNTIETSQGVRHFLFTGLTWGF